MTRIEDPFRTCWIERTKWRLEKRKEEGTERKKRIAEEDKKEEVKVDKKKKLEQTYKGIKKTKMRILIKDEKGIRRGRGK